MQKVHLDHGSALRPQQCTKVHFDHECSKMHKNALWHPSAF